MDILAFIIVGLLAGWIAGLIMKGRGFGMGGDIVVGVVGALIGGLVFDILGIEAYGFIGALLSAVIGALILLAIVAVFKKPTHNVHG